MEYFNYDQNEDVCEKMMFLLDSILSHLNTATHKEELENIKDLFEDAVCIVESFARNNRQINWDVWATLKDAIEDSKKDMEGIWDKKHEELH